MNYSRPWSDAPRLTPGPWGKVGPNAALGHEIWVSSEPFTRQGADMLFSTWRRLTRPGRRLVVLAFMAGALGAASVALLGVAIQEGL
jgi:hypothetical protein